MHELSQPCKPCFLRQNLHSIMGPLCVLYVKEKTPGGRTKASEPPFYLRVVRLPWFYF